MFGFLYGFLSMFSRVGNGIKNNIEENEYRQRAINNNDLIYIIPGKGSFLTSNCRQVYKDINSDGDTVIKDLKNGIVYCNLDEKRRQDNSQKIKNQGETTRVLDNKEYNQAKKIPAFGECVLFRDVETNKLLKRMEVNGLFFYMDIEGHILRLIDKEDEKRRPENKLSIDMIIRLFNKYQDSICNKYNNIKDNDWSMIQEKAYHFYYLKHRAVVKQNGEVHIYYDDDMFSQKYLNDLKEG